MLSGRIVDELGDPMAGASVQVLQIMYRGGRRRLPRMSARLTDDLGRHCLFGWPRRAVTSSARRFGEVSSADVPGYASSHYPGTPNAGVRAVRPDRSVAGRDGRRSARCRSRTARITGTVFSRRRADVRRGAAAALEQLIGIADGHRGRCARVLRDGLFRTFNRAGQHVIQADRGKRQQSIEGEFARGGVNGEDVTI